jgi:hypothetical protein
MVTNRESLGMEAAANLGIRNSQSDYIVIHDDDDSWAPKFLEETIAYLESPAGSRYGGVITQSVYVSEEIRGRTVIERDRQPYKAWVRNVQLAEMARGNFFPPIAFVYRRALWEEIGGYNEDLPVLGDWYFNMEFLLRADIGVIPEPYAYYHHRNRNNFFGSDLYCNSVTAGVSKHMEFDAVARNEFLRKNLDRFPAAAAVIAGHGAVETRHTLGKLAEDTQHILSELADKTLTPQSGTDTTDRYWVAAQANRALANQKGIASRYGKGAARGIDPDDSLDAMLDYLSGLKTSFPIPPPPDFDEGHYLSANPDVAAAVNKKEILNGYYHYLLFGRHENRERPSKGV